MRSSTARRVLHGALACAAAAVLACSCARSMTTDMAKPPKVEIPGGGRCTVGRTQSHPLVVEWPAADRASLEARLAHGLVAVRAHGCDIEVLRGCRGDAAYGYVGLTRKNDRVRIRNRDELYANLPLGAASLEGKLARYKGLDVEIALVGMYEAPEAKATCESLEGDCAAATHIITGAQVGAFRFYAGGAGEIRAGVEVGKAGVGGGSVADRETLSADGSPTQCDASTTADTRPPEGCGAIIRIELTPLPVPTPTCPQGSAWNGSICVTVAPVAARVVATPSPTPVLTPTPVSPSSPAAPPSVAPSPPAQEDEGAALCRKACERDLECKAAAENVAAPEGGGREAYLRMCSRTCEFMTNDFTRPQLRACLALEGCDEFEACISPDFEEDRAVGDDEEGWW